MINPLFRVQLLFTVEAPFQRRVSSKCPAADGGSRSARACEAAPENVSASFHGTPYPLQHNVSSILCLPVQGLRPCSPNVVSAPTIPLPAPEDTPPVSLRPFSLLPPTLSSPPSPLSTSLNPPLRLTHSTSQPHSAPLSTSRNPLSVPLSDPLSAPQCLAQDTFKASLGHTLQSLSLESSSQLTRVRASVS